MTDTSKEAVERLALFAVIGGTGYMAPATDGRYVRASDYDALLSECDALQAQVEGLTKENDRLAKAWEAKHDYQVKQSKSHAEYFDKSQRRMHELVAERDAALAREGAVAIGVLEAAERACAGIAGDPRMYSSDHRRGAGQCQAAIRTLTTADALAKLDQIRAEERAAGRREGMPSVDDLAQIIRCEDGDNSKGAGELAEAILAAMEKEQGE